MRLIKSSLILFLGILVLSLTSAFEPIKNQYVSPEHIYITKDNGTIYIGLSTFSGVAVFDIANEKITRIISMPGAVSGVVLDEKENILYAGSRNNRDQIYVYDLINGKEEASISIAYGIEELVISNNNRLLFAANKFTNNISVIDLENQKEISRIEVVREPVALSVSPDEKMLAVANLLPVQSAMDKYISANVSLIEIENRTVVKNVVLPNGSFALKDILFSNDGKFIYVTHLIGRFNVLTSQIEKGWINTNAISIIDVKTQELYTTVLLDDIYKGAANPCGLEISEDNKQLFVAVSGTHELFVIDREAMHSKIEKSKENSKISQSVEEVSVAKENVKVFQKFSAIKQMEVLFEDIPNELGFLASVRKRVQLTGKGPSRIISTKNKVYVTSYFSDGVECVDLNSFEIQFIPIGNKDVLLSEVRFGELLFHDAGNCFQHWQSCASCHPGNGRVDGLNWDLLNDGIGNPKNTKSLLYSHATPPTMISGIREDGETCVRAGFKYIQFFDASEEYSKAVDSYLKSLRPVPSPYLTNGELSSSAKKGKLVFEERKCNQCHSGNYYTDLQKYEMGVKGRYDKQNVWDTPTLIEVWRTAPYLHNGEYEDLDGVFKQGKHGLQEFVSDIDLKNLTEYLLSL